MNKIFATMMLLLLNLNIYAADLTKNEATHLVLSHLSVAKIAYLIIAKIKADLMNFNNRAILSHQY